LSHAFLPSNVSMSRPSACPGLLRIVPARDGGICRIKLPCGELHATQAFAIADAIEAHAGGVIDVTNRANLQLRGVKTGHEQQLIDRLLAAQLGPRDTPNAFADDVRNVMVSPAFGRDSSASFDTSGLAADLLSLLQHDARFAALSPKFALLIDGGERLAMLDHPHDIWCAAMRPADHGDVLFGFGLAGCPPVDSRHPPALAAVQPSQVIALIDALIHTFLDLAAPEQTRMRDLLAVHSHGTVLAHVEKRIDFPLLRGPAIDAWRRPPADAALRLGAHRQHGDDRWHVGGQPLLGRIDAATLRGLATLAQDLGNATLRMTPWQSVLLTDVATNNVPAALRRLEALGLTCDPARPLARVIACTGSTGCAKSLTDTKSDAQQLAVRLPANVEVHLSGCPRSCAAAHRAPYTLLAVTPGRYDLYQTHDPRDTGFGRCIARGLTIDEAASALQAPVRPTFDEPFDA
jgi:precorrin-3B synthase